MNISLDEMTDGLEMDYLVAYTSLMLEQRYNDREFLLSTIDKDTVLFNESGELISVNEGFIDNISKYIATMTDVIAGVIQKFLNGIKNAIGKSEEKLRKNEGLIKTGKNISRGDTFQNYHDYSKAIEAITGDTLSYKIDSVSDIEQQAANYDTVEKYIQAVNPAGNIGFNKDNGSYKKQILSYYRGNAMNLQDKELTPELRSSMHLFCTQTYQKALQSIEEDKNNIVKFAEDAETRLKQMKQQVPANANPGAVANNNQQGQQPQPQPQNAAALLQSTFDTYFHEDDEQMTIKHDNTAGDQQQEQKDDSAKTFENAIKAATKANNDMLSAKLTLTNEIYSKYSRILNWYINAASQQNNANQPDQKDQNAITKFGNKLKQLGNNFTAGVRGGNNG